MKYTFTKEAHFDLVKQGYQIKKEGYTYDGDVAVDYVNASGDVKQLLRPDDPSYSGIMPKWESIEADIAFEKKVKKYWENELAKPQPQVHYLPSAQRPAEGFVGPLIQ